MGFPVPRVLLCLPAIAAFVAVALMPGKAAAQGRPCVISTAQMASATPTPPLRFGIYPGGPAGSVDPKAPPRPEDPVQRLAALQGLRGDSPFVVRLYSGWTGDSRADDVSGWLDDEIAGDPAAGLQGGLPVRNKPADPDPATSPAPFAAYLRGIVRRYGDDPGFTSLQVANEANITGAPGAS